MSRCLRAGRVRLASAAWYLGVIAWIAGCAGTGPPVAPPSPAGGGAAPAAGAVATTAADSAADVVSSPSDSGAVVVVSSPADSGAVAPAPASQAQGVEASAAAISARPDEPWQVEGDRLEGRVDGPLEIQRVTIQHAGLTIAAEQGRIDPETRRAELHGQVSIRDSLRWMTGDHAHYTRDQALLEMQGKVRGRGPEGTFEADELRYDRKAEHLWLTGSVHLEEPGRSLGARWLQYHARDSLMTAGGGVQIVETADSVEVLGDLLTYDRAAGLATVVSSGARRPRLTRFFAEGPPFEVEADTLDLYTLARTGEARGAVTFERGGVHGTSRRVLFRLDEDRVLLLGDPRVSDADGWVKGDSMAVDLIAGRADRLLVWHGACAEYLPPGRPGEAHVAVGDSLTALIEGGGLGSVLVEGNAQALYVPTPEDREEGVGVNWTRARRLRLVLRDAGVERIQFEGGTEGRYTLPRAASPDSAAQGDSSAGPAAPGALLAALPALERSGELLPPDSLLLRDGFDPQETVSYRGERIEFEVASERILIQEQGWVEYQGMQLTAGEILFDSARQLVRAREAPELKETGSAVRGEEMTYRIDTRKGLVFQGRSEFEGGYYRGERVKRIDPQTYFARNADFTTCDQEEPHYHFRAGRMRIQPGEKAVGRPVVLYIGHVPILAIPYAVFPIRTGRHSGLLIPNVEFGFDSRRGRFLKNLGYYFAPSDYWDSILWLDYVESTPSVTFWNRTRYRVRYKLNGGFQASHAQERGERRRNRWSVDADHDQTLGERFTLKLDARFVSDKNYFEDQEFGSGIDEQLKRQLRSQVSLSKSWSGISANLAADRTENLDRAGGSVRVTQRAPSVSINLSSLPLGVKPNERGAGGRLPFLASTYLSGSFRTIALYTRPWEGESETEEAAGLQLQLSDRRRVADALNLTPSFSASAAWAAEDRNGGRNPVGATWRTGLSAGTTLYGTFFPRVGALEGLRHVIDLSASYGYSPEFPYLRDFPSVGGIGLSSSKSSSVSFSLNQRLHLKLLRGETAHKIENLLTWSSSTAYNFLAAEGSEPWSDLSHSLRLKPGGPFSSELMLTHDLESWTRSRLSVNSHLSLTGSGGRSGGGTPAGPQSPEEFGTTGTFEIGPESAPAAPRGGPWSLGLTHTFSVGKEWDTRASSLNVSAGLSPTRRWNLRYAVYYDLTDKEVTSQAYTLTRDLHCWRLVFDRQMRGGRATYRLLISIKDLPDIKYERRRN